MPEYVADGLVVGADRNEGPVVNRHEREAAQRGAESADRELERMRYPAGDEKHAHAAKRDVEDDCDEPDSSAEQSRPGDVDCPEAGAARETEQRCAADQHDAAVARFQTETAQLGP